MQRESPAGLRAAVMETEYYYGQCVLNYVV